MSRKKWSWLATLVLIATLVLSACQPQTVVVKETVVATQVVEVEKVITATPEPEATAPSLPAVSPTFKNPDTFVIITGAGEPETLDPAWTYETAGSAVENNIYEALVWFNKGRTDEFVPVLSTGWKINDAGDVWTFDVREGVTFHKGGTLEPHDVAYSLQRALLQDRIDGPHWMTLEAFFGLYAIRDLAIETYAEAQEIDPESDAYGDLTFDDVDDAALVETCEKVKAAVVADDAAGTVTYNLFAPTPWFLAMLANSFMGAVTDQEWMVENGAWDGTCDNWVQWNDPAQEDTILFDEANGTGPYMLDHWTPAEEIVMVANEDYWRTEPIWEGGPSGVPSIKRVVMKNITEWGTRLAMFEAGDADWIYVPSQYRPQLEPYYQTVCLEDLSCTDGNADGYILAYRDLPQAAMTPAQLNWQINIEGGNPYVGSGEVDGNGIPPDFFADEHVRKGFNYAFDFEAMIDDALNGEGNQAQGPIIAGMMGYREGEAPLYSFDLAKAEEEFKLAFDGKLWDKGFYVQLTYNSGNDTRRLSAEILKAGIEAINPKFSVQVVSLPWPVMLAARRAGKIPIYVSGWLEDFHDPHNWVHPFLHSQGSYGRIVNLPEDMAATYDGLIEQAAALTTVEERRPIYEEIQLKAQQDAINIWLYQAVGRQHFQTWLNGFYYNPAYSAAAYSYIYALSKEAP